MYALLRNILFLFSAEKAHYLAMDLLSIGLKTPLIGLIIKRSFKSKNENKKLLLGIYFPNKIGLAAGFDKDARWLPLLKTLGFGHVEVGTVTPLAQLGNPKPRLFRLKKDKALINRMGFNNEGLDAMVKRLKNRPSGLIVGGNIGKNKNTPNENALNDYVKCYLALNPHVDYIAVNVSSPNTPGLRELQDKGFLTELFVALKTLRNSSKEPKPILLKIAPDLTVGALDDIIETINAVGIDGIIATNTTISRNLLTIKPSVIEAIGAGGLSGKPIFDKSNEIIHYLRQNLGADFPIIGVGGILTMEDGKEKIKSGADLVQVYTGFIYSGPWMVKKWAVL
jgi:dihydroorotate dehydrogenase